MFIINMYAWWFTTGWAHLTKTLLRKMGDVLKFFSISSLLRTLFAPFRQISATASGNTSRLAAFGDRLVSRLVGATVRIFLMLAGLAAFITEAIAFTALIICWPLFPFLPIAGVIMCCNGVIF